MPGLIPSPNITGNRRFRSYINQTMATTGRTPDPESLDQMVQSEIENMRKGLEESRRFTENQRQFDIDQQNTSDTAAANRRAGLIGAGAQLGTTAMTINALRGKPLMGDALTGLVKSAKTGLAKVFG